MRKTQEQTHPQLPVPKSAGRLHTLSVVGLMSGAHPACAQRLKSKMYVIKRDGRQQEVHFDKITARISKLSYGLNPDFCDPVSGAESRSK